MIVSTICILSFACLIVGCASTPAPSGDTMRLCDTNGCEEVDKDTARFDPSSKVPDADPEGRIPALEEMARNDPRAAHDLSLRLFRGDGVRRDRY